MKWESKFNGLLQDDVIVKPQNSLLMVQVMFDEFTCWITEVD